MKLFHKKCVVFTLVVMVLAGAMLLPGCNSGDNSMAGTWVFSAATGDHPNVPSQIIFRGEGNSGTGEFITPLLGTHVVFAWNRSDGIFYMSRFPADTGIIAGFGTTTWYVRRGELMFTYPNGSTVTYTRQ